MANEFVHSSVGTSLSQLEFEAVGLHVLNSQATGDLIYASSSSQLSRLAIGAADTVLTCNGTVPSWSATPILNTAVAKGTWTASGTWTLPAVSLGGTVQLNSQSLNATSASAFIDTTGAAEGLTVRSTQGGTFGAALRLEQISGSPAAGDAVAYIRGIGRSSTNAVVEYGYMVIKIDDPLNTNKGGSFSWTAMSANAANVAMTLTGAGVLAVDLSGSGAAAQVDLFDDYDDALVLRQGIQQNNRELLADMGVLERKDTGSGYMMKIQPMVRLLAGGIYQSRQLIDNTREEMVKRIESLESKLMLLGAG